MNKLEPICRVLCECDFNKMDAWPLYESKARAVVQSQIKMLDKDLYIGFEDECIVRAWLRSLLEPEDAPDKSLSQKMHEAGFTPRKQGKAVREDE